MRVLIVGCGYVGAALGGELVSRGHVVAGLRRSRLTAVKQTVELLSADITNRADLEALPRDWDWVVNCVGSSGSTPDEYRRTYVQGNRNLLEWLSAHPPGKYIYTSSTSVYGQDDGSWVSEDDPTVPATETGQVLVEAEQLVLQAGSTGLSAMVMRLSGIYGYDRGYWLKQFLAGQARRDDGSGRFVNMIHRDDVVGAVIAAAEKGIAGSVYNVSDNEPATQASVLDWLATRLNRPVPPENAGLALRKRAATNKRVSNRRLLEHLGYDLRYPTFREGFEAELKRLGM